MVFKILVIEDDELIRSRLLDVLQSGEGAVSGTGSGRTALDLIEKNRYDLLIVDSETPEMELLSRAREANSEVEVILIADVESGRIDSVATAMRQGAYDYLTKPINFDELLLKVRQLRDRKALVRENAALKAYAGIDRGVSIIAKNAGMCRILDMIEGMKGSDCNVLLTGETGVGKNLLAKIIHYTSRRKAMPFLSINCATLTEELLASELFGHEKGAFTGAVRGKQGLVEIADTGTLFLDEIAEMTPSLQAKLLKVIEEGEFYRVGATKPVKADVRFLAATNQNVQSLISDGKFREDLYYRLNIMEIFIAPLRDRRDDIAPLCFYFLEKHLQSSGKKITGFTRDAMDILMRYSYPGNVRELENIVERAIILEKNTRIGPASLPQAIQMFRIDTIEPDAIKTIEELNREYAEKVLDFLGGSRQRTAAALGISRTSLWRLLKRE